SGSLARSCCSIRRTPRRTTTGAMHCARSGATRPPSRATTGRSRCGRTTRRLTSRAAGPWSSCGAARRRSQVSIARSRSIPAIPARGTCAAMRCIHSAGSRRRSRAMTERSRSSPLPQARTQIADWRDFGPEVARLAARIERGEPASNPFAMLALCDCPPLQLRAAQNWVRAHCSPGDMLPALAARGRGERLRVGYFSADFRCHAISYLTAELFEAHDRSRHELTAFSLGADTQDDMRKRLEASFDRFLDVQEKSDHDIARLARSLQIDIAVDLGG